MKLAWSVALLPLCLATCGRAAHPAQSPDAGLAQDGPSASPDAGAAASRCRETGWIAEDVARIDVDEFGTRSLDLAVTAAGSVHAVYEGDLFGPIVYLSRDAPNEWGTESFSGTEAKLAVDRGEGVHMSYRIGPFSSMLGYAYKSDGEEWTHEGISVGFVPASHVIAIDPLGNPQIAYSDLWSDVGHAVRGKDGTWRIREATVQGAALFEIGIDESGHAQVGARQWIEAPGGDTFRVVHASISGDGTWDEQLVDEQDCHSLAIAFAIEASGAFHAAYMRSAGEGCSLRYAFQSTAGVLQVTDLMISETECGVQGMGVDPWGGVHLKFWQHEENLYVRSTAGGAWLTEPTPIGGGHAFDTCEIAADDHGAAHLLCAVLSNDESSEKGTAELTYAYRCP